MKVKVWNGNGKKFLGYGDYIEDVIVYFYEKNGILKSKDDAEKPFTEEEKKIMEERGESYMISYNNPKIVMDNGSIVYGCQVWWDYVDLEEGMKNETIRLT